MSPILHHFNASGADLTLLKEGLPSYIFSDKVLHEKKPVDRFCNTLSGGHYGIIPEAHPGHARFVRATTLLEDHSAGRNTAICRTIGPAVSRSSRLSQQLYTQVGFCYGLKSQVFFLDPSSMIK